MSLELDEHREYLSDLNRVRAFRRALAEVVRPEDVVLDLGAGTGVLGMLACAAGARHVYSVDGGGIAELARAFHRANGFQDRATVIRGFSTRIELPQRADVVVADQIGRFGFEAGVLQYFADARRRLLRPGARAVPSRIDLWVAPVERDDLARQVRFWQRRVEGLSFGPAAEIARNTGYPVELRATDLLGAPLRGASVDTLAHGDDGIEFEVRLLVTRGGRLDGLGGWFSAQLSPSVAMTNSPLAARRIRRRNAFLPLARPLKVARGDELHAALTIRPREVALNWRVEVRRHGAVRARFKHSTLLGLLIAREELALTRPDCAPRLTAWGRARRTVLELCDGARPLRDIETEVFRRHAELFRTPAEAATFTAEVVTVYAQ